MAYRQRKTHHEVYAQLAAGGQECAKCRRFKPLADFSPNRKRKIGIQSWCKACVAACNLSRRQEARAPAEIAARAMLIAFLNERDGEWRQFDIKDKRTSDLVARMVDADAIEICAYIRRKI